MMLGRRLWRGIRVEAETALEETVRDFLPPSVFYNQLGERGFDFFTGVPDSLLKDFCGYVSDNAPPSKHIISANEGTAVAIASGYHMATHKYPVVYLQNSGLGNIINPLLSLVDPRVYRIPMLLLIGWRGEPGRRDEPQHMVQGGLMNSLLTNCGLNYEVLADYEEGAAACLDSALHHLRSRSSPYAFLVRRQCFLKYKTRNQVTTDFPVSREQALMLTSDSIGRFDPVVASTGFISRELYEIREAQGIYHGQDFYSVGSMGHCSSIAMGVALAKPARNVYCLDGDGAVLMQMGALATIGGSSLTNFKHVLYNNCAHDSVGGQPTAGTSTDFAAVAKSTGYKHVESATTEAEIVAALENIKKSSGPSFLEIKVARKTRENLGRPKGAPEENKHKFMDFLSQ
jgi:phosphonopyruvate decarboxylase